MCVLIMLLPPRRLLPPAPQPKRKHAKVKEADAPIAPSAYIATKSVRSDVPPTCHVAPTENASVGTSGESATSLHLVPHFADLISQIK